MKEEYKESVIAHIKALPVGNYCEFSLGGKLYLFVRLK